MLKIGQAAPSLFLLDQNGDEFDLKELIGQKLIVLYFYPKDETPGCTAEACSFRDHYEDFKDIGAEVIGVSRDSVESHRNFAMNRILPFILLSDTDNAVHDAYKVGKSMLGMMSNRVTYLIDKRGTIRHAFSSQLNIKKHVKDSLSILGKITDN